jgi:hypothetical protein
MFRGEGVSELGPIGSELASPLFRPSPSLIRASFSLRPPHPLPELALHRFSEPWHYHISCSALIRSLVAQLGQDGRQAGLHATIRTLFCYMRDPEDRNSRKECG